ncbi:condensation domain-containing protein [Lentzea sp. NPDC051213]|uniref:condensation domain-containing protein n=1 Tax=Lentzea sp. NPDC051213 TaxID=3364126 RepID=UPI00378F3A6A
MECALSVGQEALWFIHRMAPESAVYNVAWPMRVHTRIDVPTLARATAMAAERHGVLRSVFTEVEGLPRRIISDTGPFGLEVRDVPGIDDEELVRLVRDEVARPFRLQAGAPCRLVLLRVAADNAALVFVSHHIAMDLPSLVVVLQDILDAYQALLAGGRPDWPPLTLTYADFVARERKLLDSPRADVLVGHWRDVCAGAPTLLDLPTDRPRPARQRFRGASVDIMLPDDVVVGLVPAARANRVTPVRHLLAVFQTLLYRHTHQQDFLLGCAATSTFGFDRKGVPGFYTNTIPLRARCAAGTTFSDVTAEVNRQLVAGMAHVDYPFALLPKALGLPRLPGTSPLFQVMVSMVSVGRAKSLMEMAAGGHGFEMDYAGLWLSTIGVGQQEGQFDLTLEVVRTVSSVRCDFKYDIDLFDEATIRRLSDHFVRLLRAAAADPDQRVVDVPLTDESERARLLAFATGR